MATGLVTLGTAALGAAGSASSTPGAPAMAAPQNQQQENTFGGAHKEAMSLGASVSIGVAVVLAALVITYGINSK